MNSIPYNCKLLLLEKAVNVFNFALICKLKSQLVELNTEILLG
jgi:hypothetical protein